MKKKITPQEDEPKYPGWVPKLVVLHCRGLYPLDYLPGNCLQDSEAFVNATKIMERLLSDEKMKSVWQELFRKNKKTRKYLHPPLIKVGLRHQAEKNNYSEQERAAALFLEECYRQAVSDRARSVVELEEAKAFFESTAVNMRKQKEHIKKIGLRIHEWHDEEIFEAFDALIEMCEDEIGDLKGKLRRAAKRLRNEPEVSDKIKRINKLTRCYFGKSLLGTIANLVNVILDRNNITRERVHNVLYPRVAKQKKVTR